MEEEAQQQLTPTEKDEFSGDGETVMGATSSGTAVDDELSLPKATVYKLITEMLPSGVSCPRETRDLLITCCVEFIHLVSGEANEICEKSGRKTISPEHVVEALKALGFSEWVDEVLAAHGEATEQAREKQASRGSNKLDKSGLTEEELIKQQEELFESARKRYLEGQQGRSSLPEPLSCNSPAPSVGKEAELVTDSDDADE